MAAQRIVAPGLFANPGQHLVVAGVPQWFGASPVLKSADGKHFAGEFPEGVGWYLIGSTPEIGRRQLCQADGHGRVDQCFGKRFISPLIGLQACFFKRVDQIAGRGLDNFDRFFSCWREVGIPGRTKRHGYVFSVASMWRHEIDASVFMLMLGTNVER